MLHYRYSALGQSQQQPQQQVTEACDRLMLWGNVQEARDLIFAIQAVFTSAEDDPKLSTASKEEILSVHGAVDRIERLIAKFVPRAHASIVGPDKGTLCSALSLANLLSYELRANPDMAEQGAVLRETVDLLRFRMPDDRSVMPDIAKTPGASKPVKTLNMATALIVGGAVLTVVGATTWSLSRSF